MVREKQILVYHIAEEEKYLQGWGRIWFWTNVLKPVLRFHVL
jgi:hypothetical protein